MSCVGGQRFALSAFKMGEAARLGICNTNDIIHSPVEGIVLEIAQSRFRVEIGDLIYII